MQKIRDGYRQRAEFIAQHSPSGEGQIGVNVRDLLAILGDADELERLRAHMRTAQDRIAIERFGVMLANARIDRLTLYAGWARSVMNESAKARTLDLYRPEIMRGDAWGSQILDALSMFKQSEPVRADPALWPPEAPKG